MTYDLTIRNGTLVDGTGRPRRTADVGIEGTRVVEVVDRADGGISGRSRRTIDADGRLVTPGFVDVHTHLDAQVGWDPNAASASWHGVTSAVMGNCGLSLAPCRDGDRELLASMLESVEGIPAELTLAASWDWTNFSDHIDVLDRLPKTINVGTLVGHSAIRLHAMGERAFDDAPASGDDIATMIELVDLAMAAGALGLSTSRTTHHKLGDGRPVPTVAVAADELLALAGVLDDHGAGVVQAALRLGEGDDERYDATRSEVALFGEISRRSGRSVTFGLTHTDRRPDLVEAVLEFAREENGIGGCVRPQTTARGIAILFGLETRTPFDRAPSWKELRAAVNGRKLQMVRDPSFRQLLIKEADVHGSPIDLDRLFVLPSGAVRHDTRPDESLNAIASARGVSPAAAWIELILESDGHVVASMPYLNRDLRCVAAMLDDPLVVLGLTDTGAHLGQLMNTGQPTFHLTHWIRDRERWTVEEGVRRLTADPADLFGLHERGRIESGAFADLNVIDLDELALLAPEYSHVLPGGRGCYVQRARGYDYTIVNGAVAVEDGEHTGSLAGNLLRSR